MAIKNKTRKANPLLSSSGDASAIAQSHQGGKVAKSPGALAECKENISFPCPSPPESSPLTLNIFNHNSLGKQRAMPRGHRDGQDPRLPFQNSIALQVQRVELVSSMWVTTVMASWAQNCRVPVELTSWDHRTLYHHGALKIFCQTKSNDCDRAL